LNLIISRPAGQRCSVSNKRFLVSFFLILFITVPASYAQGYSSNCFRLSADDLILLPTGYKYIGAEGDYVLSNGLVTAIIAGSSRERNGSIAPVMSGDITNLAIMWQQPDSRMRLSPGCIGLSKASIETISILEPEPGDAGSLLMSGHITGSSNEGGGGIWLERVIRLASRGTTLEIETTYINEGTYSWVFDSGDIIQAGRLLPGCSGECPLAIFESPSFACAIGISFASGSVNVCPVDNSPGLYHISYPDARQPDVLRPGGRFTLARRITVMRNSSLLLHEWTSRYSDFRSGLWLKLTMAEKESFPGAVITLDGEGLLVRGKSTKNGSFSLQLPPGTYMMTCAAPGAVPVTRELDFFDRMSVREIVEVNPPGGIDLSVLENKSSVPSQIQVFGENGTPDPVFSLEPNKKGNSNLYHYTQGTERIPLLPGKYRILAGRGPEYDIKEKSVQVESDCFPIVRFRLRRSVNTKGWVAASLNTHTAISHECMVSRQERLLGLACEAIEYAVASETWRLADYSNDLEEMGLETFLKTETGISLPLPSGNMITAFPFIQKAHQSALPDLRGHSTDEMIAGLRQLSADVKPLVQLAYPSVHSALASNIPSSTIDGIVLQDMLPNSFHSATPNTWAKYMNNFSSLSAVVAGVGDSLRQSGMVRCWVECDARSIDAIETGEIIQAISNGAVTLSNGPFLLIEESRKRDGQSLTLQIEVCAPSWMEVDSVSVYAMGITMIERRFTRKSHPRLFKNGGGSVFQHNLKFNFKEASQLLVVAVGPVGGLSKGLPQGNQQRPLAISRIITLEQ
jgi:hypothetical protein